MAKQIDPIYKQYTLRVMKYLASTEFYEYFMSMLEGSKNTFQFSNRRVEKMVDESWVVAIEAILKPMEEILNNPRNFIIQEEIIVNVALAKRVTPDSIRHLAQHGSMVDNVTDDDVRPNRLMDKTKEDSWNTYENRFVYTLLEMAWEFVDKRYEAIFAALGEEYGAYLKMNTQMRTYHESITANIDLRVRQEEELLSSDEKNESIFARIARLHRVLGTFRKTVFYNTVRKYGRIKPPLVKTNAIAKNPNYKACHKLWNFLQVYNDVGYKINIIDQSTVIDEAFTKDIYHSILMNYIILKNHLEDPSERNLNINTKQKKKQLKPKFIKEIIEEMTKNYDLPDVEIRKVLIEEITKAQLMQEEENERLRLVEEKEKELAEKKKQEDKEKARLAKEAEKERLRQLKEQEAQALREQKERERQEQADLRRGEQFKAELEDYLVHIEEYMARKAKAKEDEARRIEAERLAAEKAEQERLAKEAERQTKAKEAEEARAAKAKEAEEAKAAKAKEAEAAKAAKAKEAEEAKAAKAKEAEAAKAAKAKEAEAAKAAKAKEMEAAAVQEEQVVTPEVPVQEILPQETPAVELQEETVAVEVSSVEEISTDPIPVKASATEVVRPKEYVVTLPKREVEPPVAPPEKPAPVVEKKPVEAVKVAEVAPPPPSKEEETPKQTTIFNRVGKWLKR